MPGMDEKNYFWGEGMSTDGKGLHKIVYNYHTQHVVSVPSEMHAAALISCGRGSTGMDSFHEEANPELCQIPRKCSDLPVSKS